MDTYVLYHKNCYDGFGSAFCAWMHWGNAATYIPVAYGEPLPEMEDNSSVYILDFSFPRDVLENLVKRMYFVKVLDHHKSAEEALRGLPFCTFDMKKSGAKLSFEYFSAFGPMLDRYKGFIDYISDRDLWENQLSATDEVHAALSSYPKDFEVWKTIGRDIPYLAKEGVPILRHVNTTVGMMCDQSFMTDKFSFSGHGAIPCVNATGYWNEVCHEMLKRYPQYPFVSAFFKRSDGKTQWSLRSRTTEDFDVTEIAKQLKGGGHKHAAGFTE